MTTAEAAAYIRDAAALTKKKMRQAKLSSSKAVAAAQRLADQGHEMTCEDAELITAVALAWARNQFPDPSVWDDDSNCQGMKAHGVALQHLDTAALRVIDADDVILAAYAHTSYVAGELQWLRGAEDLAFHTMVIELYRGMDRVYADESLWPQVTKKLHSLRERRAAMRAETLTDLSCALVMAWERYDDVDGPTSAVTASRLAVQLCDGVSARHALGKAAWAAYQVTGDQAYLDEALGVLRPLEASTPLGHPSAPTAAADLLMCLGTMALDTRDSAVLDEAVALGERLLPTAHHARPEGCWEVRAHLVPLLVAQSQRDHDPAPLVRALALCDEAVRAAAADRSGVDDDGPRPIPTYPLAHIASAQAYLARAQATGLPDDAQVAVAAAQKAAEVCAAVWRSRAAYTTDLLDAARQL